MLFGRRKKNEFQKISYDPETQKPVIRASICTGEKVGGLMDLKKGTFTEIQWLRSAADIEAFCEACGVETVETIY